MTARQVWIGTMGPFEYDDAEVGVYGPDFPAQTTVAVFGGQLVADQALLGPNVTSVIDPGHTHTAGSLDPDLQTLFQTFSGTILETIDVDVTSDGATITVTVQQSGGGDLTVMFSDGFTIIDSDPTPKTVSLTAGTATVPQTNYIYILKTDPQTLVSSTISFPTAEHARIAKVVVQTAALVQASGALLAHVHTDHAVDSNNVGHASVHYGNWIRSQHATWLSGVVQTVTVDTVPAPDEVDLATTSGTTLQLHQHTFPAFDTAGGDLIYVVNDNASPFTTTSDIETLTSDSAGGSMANRYYTLVFWGSISEDTGDSQMFVNLPAGSYVRQDDALGDVSSFSNYTIPEDYRGAAFLILALTLRNSGGGNVFTSILETDLRGFAPNTLAGAGAGGGAGGGAGIDTTAIHEDQPAEISAIAAKGTPVGGDFLLIEDSADSDNKKSVTISALEAILNHDSLAGFTATEHFTMLDEDDLASDSDTQAATQQSIKAYVDALAPSSAAGWSYSTPVISLNVSSDRVQIGPQASTATLHVSKSTSIFNTFETVGTGYMRNYAKRNSVFIGSWGSDTSGVFGWNVGSGTGNIMTLVAGGHLQMDGDLSVDGGDLTLGVVHSVASIATLYGNATTTGGSLIIHPGANDDTATDAWQLTVENGGDFLVQGMNGTVGTYESIRIDQATRKVTIGLGVSGSIIGKDSSISKGENNSAVGGDGGTVDIAIGGDGGAGGGDVGGDGGTVDIANAGTGATGGEGGTVTMVAGDSGASDGIVTVGSAAAADSNLTVYGAINDLTPAWLSDGALAAVLKITDDGNGGIDHDSLPLECQTDLGNGLKGRNIGMTLSLVVSAMQELAT